jgi:hypothetical protein
VTVRSPSATATATATELDLDKRLQLEKASSLAAFKVHSLCVGRQVGFSMVLRLQSMHDVQCTTATAWSTVISVSVRRDMDMERNSISESPCYANKEIISRSYPNNHTSRSRNPGRTSATQLPGMRWVLYCTVEMATKGVASPSPLPLATGSSRDGCQS